MSSLIALPYPTFAKSNTMFFSVKMDNLKTRTWFTRQKNIVIRTILKYLQVKSPYYKNPRGEQVTDIALFIQQCLHIRSTDKNRCLVSGNDIRY